MTRPSDPGLLIQELIYAGLDAMRSVAPVDLCAYLHLSSDEGPQLFLATPDLAAVDPTEAFTLFTALRDTLEHEHDGDETLLLGRYLATGITTQGPTSKGLHVFGTHDQTLDAGRRETLIRLARAMGGVAHRLEAAEGGTPGAAPLPLRTPLRVAVESGETGARAEVAVSIGDEIRTGLAQDATPIRAVAAAVIDAIDASLKLVEASDGDVGGERAVLVLMSSEQGRQGLGAALVGQEADPLRAAAVAALEAATRVTARGADPSPHR